VTALSAVVFALSWWMGLYLAVRDPRKPALVLAAVGLCGFATVVALDAIRMAGEVSAESLGRVEIYLVVLPGVAWFAVLMELARPHDAGGGRGRDVLLTAVVAAAAANGAALLDAAEDVASTGIPSSLRPDDIDATADA